MGWVTDKGGKVKKYEQGGKVGRRQDVEPRPERPPGDDIPGRGHGHHWTLEQEPVIGGWVKDKGASGKKYKKGGKVLSGLNIKHQSIKENKDGSYDATVYIDVPKEQVGGEGGGKRRVYKGESKGMYDYAEASKAARLEAKDKMKTSPADSVITGGPEKFKKIKEPPKKTDTKKKTKKKKGFFKRRK